MAKYLDTSHISSELMELLKEAKEKIILVTYSLKVNTQIQERLRTKSKIGTLAEITIIYGNTELKKSELEWMSEIEDIKIWQKKNLHAKCYINENKAIISSMNLYDYSQTTNIEMGFLITKEDDEEAYNKIMEDIKDMRINGTRVKPWIENSDNPIQTEFNNTEKKINLLPYNQQIKKKLLEWLRDDLSPVYRQKSNTILSDQEILEIISLNNVTPADLKRILKTNIKFYKLKDEVLRTLENVSHFTVGVVMDKRYQNNDFSYDQIQLKRFDDNSIKWYNTKQELPKKEQIVAVSLNDIWFNDYFILDETNDINVEQTSQSKNFSNSTYHTTNELSKLSGIPSREINSNLVAMQLMEKRGNDWFATENGEALGAIQKDGQYGKFIIWPEEILSKLDIN
ncbi:phospholipase D-like domain-containing protein [Saccharicrinis sp. FJH2]|uniref:phospholipase D-like domain-containing protein n=1 Tax=Saccharicrinis sp. FJH65 TaxID=3344659 RepID=UPI0035F27A65